MALTPRLRLGIVGLGRMGLRHWHAWKQLDAVELVAICDPAAAAQQWALQHRLFHCTEVESLRERIDLAVIASPSSTHCGYGLALLSYGIACLVEKPLALSSEQCRQLAECARQHDTLLAVGQCERFNPGVRRALQRLNASTTSLQVFRHASHTLPADSDVIDDLLVHDLDWVLQAGQRLISTEVLASSLVGERVQAIQCRLEFASGVQLYLSAGFDVERRREVLSSPCSVEGSISLEWQPGGGQGDPLTLQAQAFLSALRGEASGIATAMQALTVMQLCEQLRRQLRPMPVQREAVDA
ncbi:MAG: Gfo/Idh/MocA family oxidoreductase [Pseudomonas sp.]|uniref:Gfo/Idh/MocA family protein n=1 Tax=Pseudomonas sp. TaxID=306 RepID=UPI00339B6CBC